MIKFFNYKTTDISGIFEGFTILSEEELNDRIQNANRNSLPVFGGLELVVDSKLKYFNLISDYVSTGTLFPPAETYFTKFASKDEKKKTINLWFTSQVLAELFVRKFYLKQTNYVGDLNRPLLIISEPK